MIDKCAVIVELITTLNYFYYTLDESMTYSFKLDGDINIYCDTTELYCDTHQAGRRYIPTLWHQGK